MNRKMRAKLNNQQARARRDKRPCPKRDELVFEGDNCGTCGAELKPVALLVVEVPTPARETLH
jgi:hypothetical protein